MIFIGIDPGVKTGIAMSDSGQLVCVESMKACEAEKTILDHFLDGTKKVCVVVEDARLRQWFGSKGKEALQGAGSIKRDCQRWHEWLVMHDIPHVLVAPKHNRTKLSAEQFAKLTGWKERTNEHGRDAAMLVFGR